MMDDVLRSAVEVELIARGQMNEPEYPTTYRIVMARYDALDGGAVRKQSPISMRYWLSVPDKDNDPSCGD